jgi:hypothetical protein
MQDQTPPSVLYHYCSIHGFKGIFENQSIWMSQLSLMNDSMEHRWLKQKALDRLAVLKEKHRWSILDAPEASIPSRFYSALEIQLQTVPHVEPYCVCFSEDGDTLSQWRAYADDGKGFAIGFDSSSLSFPNNTELYQVCYDANKHATLVDDLIAQHQQELPKDPSEEMLRDAAWQFHSALLGPSIYCKNPKFIEEREWRVVHEPILVDNPIDGKTMWIGPASDSGFRVRDNQLLHYLMLPFEHKSIVKVMLGPKNPARTNTDTLRLLLQKCGFGHVTLAVSEASYR